MGSLQVSICLLPHYSTSVGKINECLVAVRNEELLKLQPNLFLFNFINLITRVCLK